MLQVTGSLGRVESFEWFSEGRLLYGVSALQGMTRQLVNITPAVPQ